MNSIIQEWITKRSVLETLFKYPEREFTMNELSKISNTSYATTWRFLQKAEKAGVVTCKKIGNSNSCKLNKNSPLIGEIKKLLEIKPSPHLAVIGELLKRVKRIRGIEKVILFGSVAKGEEKLSSDVDILLLVKEKTGKLEREVTDIADSVIRDSKIVIVPLILSFKELNENKQFRSELERGKVLYVRHKRG